MCAPVSVAWVDFHFKQNVPRDRLQVRSVTILTGSFDGTTALSNCNKRSLYDGWGTTLQKAYPTWDDLPLCPCITVAGTLNTPTSAPSFVTLSGVYFGTTDQTPMSYIAGAATPYAWHFVRTVFACTRDG